MKTVWPLKADLTLNICLKSPSNDTHFFLMRCLIVHENTHKQLYSISWLSLSFYTVPLFICCWVWTLLSCVVQMKSRFLSDETLHWILLAWNSLYFVHSDIHCCQCRFLSNFCGFWGVLTVPPWIYLHFIYKEQLLYFTSWLWLLYQNFIQSLAAECSLYNTRTCTDSLNYVISVGHLLAL